MQLTEPSVFTETGVVASLAKAGGSAPVASVRGLVENGDLERDSGETTRASTALHFTCARADATAYGEGDELTFPATHADGSAILGPNGLNLGGMTLEILDRLSDDFQTTFLLETPKAS